MLKRYLQNSTAAFARNDDGTIAVMFGVMCVAMVGVLGLAVDGGRAMGAQAKADSALDAAALAATRALFTSNMDDSEIEAYARSFFQSNIAGDGDLGAAYDALEVTINRNTKTIRLAVNTRVPTTFGRMLGIDSIKFSADSVATFNVRDIELGMALDVTGSMGGQKIADLRDAATDLVDTLIPDSGSISDVKIGLAPYSGYVNVGPTYAELATDLDDTAVCVFERNTSLIYDDAVPQVNHFFRGTPKVRSCPTATVEPMTNDKDVLKTKIADFRADGPTAGHLGLAWGWYLVSPDWSSIWPASSAPRDYGTKNLIKAVVLMTDGEFNTDYVPGVNSTDQALAICDKMKEKGMVIYTIAFQAPNAAEQTLRSCATVDSTSGDLNFYDAQNGDDLKNAFQDIAIKLTALRLDK